MPSRGEHSSLRLPIRPTAVTAPADGLRGTEKPFAASGERMLSSDYRNAAERYIRVKFSPAGPALVGALECAVRAITERCADEPPRKLATVETPAEVTRFADSR